MVHVPWQVGAQLLVAVQQIDQFALQSRLLAQQRAHTHATRCYLSLRAPKTH